MNGIYIFNVEFRVIKQPAAW